MSLTTEEYERLRRPLLQMLAEAQAQYQRNIEPIRAQLKRLADVYVSPIMVMDMSQIDIETLGRICGTTPPAPSPSRITDLPEPPHYCRDKTTGLTQAELACAGPTGPPCLVDPATPKACCSDERRSLRGGCINCGDPAL